MQIPLKITSSDSSYDTIGERDIVRYASAPRRPAGSVSVHLCLLPIGDHWLKFRV